MACAEAPDIVTSPSVFSRHAADWIGSFFARLDPSLGARVHLRFHVKDDFPDPAPERRPPDCLIGRREGDRLVVHVCCDRLAGTPLPALQAALDLELAMFALDRDGSAFAFNFQKKILPSVNVSGSAVQLIRKMVWHLEKALKLQSATRLVLDLDRGMPQVFHYFNVLNRSAGERRDYARMQRHDWMRGLFLCRKGELYLSVFLLQQAGLSPELVSFWQQSHPFLLPHDRRFLDLLARQALENSEQPFAGRLVQLFALVRSHLSI
jgi:hypothetical protein